MIVSKNIGGLPDKLRSLFISYVFSAILCTQCISLGGLKGCVFSNDIMIQWLLPVLSIVFKVSIEPMHSDL